jgi:hypothetical protein
LRDRIPLTCGMTATTPGRDDTRSMIADIRLLSRGNGRTRYRSSRERYVLPTVGARSRPAEEQPRSSGPA